MHEKISDRIRIFRESTGLTQAVFASKYGVPKGSYQKYEMGLNIPGADAIEKLVNAGLNANWLLTGQGEMLTSYPQGGDATVLTAEESMAQYRVKRPEIDAVLLSGVIAAVDMANPQLGASERAAIAAKAYAEAVSAAKPDQDSNFFSP